jgi:high-affinity Fe2+/Pb2+ permease
MSEAPEKDDPRQEPVYRAILAVLIASVLAGAVLTVAGEALFGSPALASAGFGMAVVCGVLYWVFRILGKRASARVGRRAAARQRDRED